MRIWLLALALLVLPGAARAEWYEASSPNFVVYADDSERDIRRFSEQLERYHRAMAVVTGNRDLPAPSPSNRVTVFVVKNAREIQRLAGNRFIAGFYIPRAGGSVAFVPQVQGSSAQRDATMNTLLHEYAHHFIISNSDFPTPRWLGEGAAEFFAAARFSSDEGLTIGLPAKDNYLQIAYADPVEVEELLDPDVYERRKREGYDSFYGKSWALYHYLTFDPERRGQLTRYIRNMAAGKTSREAALEAFGSFTKLDIDLEQYLARRSILSMVFEPGQLEVGRIDLRALSAGEVAMLPARIRSRRGVDAEEAAEVLVEARQVAARYQGDAAVLAALAEAEYDAGNDTEAIAAADAAIALDPSQVNAYVQKGYALFRRAGKADDPVVAYRAAVEPFIALNRLENDHPLPLVYYYRSFVERGTRPPEQAVLGLVRAAELAPFDLGLRLSLATHQIQAGDLASARANLVPIAYNPHAAGGGAVDGARRVIERIDAGGEPQSTELLALLRSSPPAPAAGEGAAGGGR